MTSLASSRPTRAGGLVAVHLPGAAHPLTFVLCLRPSAGLHSVPLPQPTSTDVTKTKPHRVRLSPRACPRSSGPRPREKMRGPGESCDARGGGRREAATSQGATGASAVLRAGEERGPGRGAGGVSLGSPGDPSIWGFPSGKRTDLSFEATKPKVLRQQPQKANALPGSPRRAPAGAAGPPPVPAASHACLSPQRRGAGGGGMTWGAGPVRRVCLRLARPPTAHGAKC